MISVFVGTEAVERLRERLAANNGAPLVVKLAKPWIDANLKGVRTQEA